MSFPARYKVWVLAIVAGTVMVLGVGFTPAQAAALENPDPAGSGLVVQPGCVVDHAVVTVTDATPPGVGPGYAGIFYYLTSSRGEESRSPDSVDRLSSFTLNSNPIAFGETVVLTVKAQLDTPEGAPQLVTIANFTATRSTSASCATTESVAPTAPTFVDKVGIVNDTYTVPSTVGVEYMVGGVVVAAGTYPAKGKMTVVAKAKTGFVLKGASTWTRQFTNVTALPDPVINPSGKVTVNARGAGTATFNNNKSTTAVGFELVKNGHATLYSVSAGAVKSLSFSDAKCGSKVIVQDGEANQLATAKVAKCAVSVVVKKSPVNSQAPKAPVKRTSNLPVPAKVQTDGGELKTNKSGILPLSVGLMLIAGGGVYVLRRREARI
ncbi:hypothetical protein H7X69_01150 [Candidatus Saccharibacteria bacterium]|nr:hypothetical protein [Candidatus Saccharibacteria bacterium]